VTDQPPSQQQPADESEGDKPAALVPDDAPTEVSAPEPPAAFAPADTPAPASAPTTAPAPPAAATSPPPPVTEPPSGDSGPSGPGALAAAFPPDRPERAVGGAFAGGLVLALILKRLAR
jgi:hypothetical protein